MPEIHTPSSNYSVFFPWENLAVAVYLLFCYFHSFKRLQNAGNKVSETHIFDFEILPFFKVSRLASMVIAFSLPRSIAFTSQQQHNKSLPDTYRQSTPFIRFFFHTNRRPGDTTWYQRCFNIGSQALLEVGTEHQISSTEINKTFIMDSLKILSIRPF